MINGMTLMLYVRNVNRAVNFWCSLGFDELERLSVEGSESVVLSNVDFGNVTMQLYDIDYVKSKNPTLAESHPVIFFTTDDIETVHETILKSTRQVTEIVRLNDDYNFSFRDLDGNEYIVHGVKTVQSLTAEVVDRYFANLQRVRVISPRDVEFLPDASVIFFGQVTNEASRDIAEEIAKLRREIYYVDTETLKLSTDLRLVLKKYSIQAAPAIIKRQSSGGFISFDGALSKLSEFYQS